MDHVRQRTSAGMFSLIATHDKAARSPRRTIVTKALLRLTTAAALAAALALPAAAETKPRKEKTPAQIQAHERQVKCGAEWKEAKAAKTLPSGATWPKFWSSCNTRL